jgi:hypothetical protein
VSVKSGQVQGPVYAGFELELAGAERYRVALDLDGLASGWIL